MSENQFVIFGSTGLIGSSLKRAIAAKFPTSSCIEVNRNSPLNPALLKKESCFVFYCQGPIDPQVDLETHLHFHVQAAQNWLDWFSTHSELNAFITLGSVHEALAGLSNKNNYLTAKRIWTEEHHRRTNAPSIHFQLHTLYGEPIRSSTFLGQMLAALKNRSEFRMSHGRQLREYHHVDDIVETILRITDPSVRIKSGSDIVLSHGKPLALKDLASGVFKYFDREELLILGAISTRSEEPTEVRWTETPAPMAPSYRPSIEGVIQLFEGKF